MSINSGNDHYASSFAVESAIKQAAKLEHSRHPERQVSDLIRQTYYDRFLSRIFSEGENSSWVLKGGSAMLARIPSTRRTLDADLFRNGYATAESLAELERLAAVNLQDFFYFERVSAKPTLLGRNQPYVDGYRVSFTVRIGVKNMGQIHVDLVTHHGAMRDVDVMSPSNRLTLPKLTAYPYRLFPIENHFSDKACAIIEKINGVESSRIKDLIDLSIIITTQRLSSTDLRTALRAECGKRSLQYPLDLIVPDSWTQAQFSKTTSGTSVAKLRITAAAALARQLLAQLYQLDEGENRIWNPQTSTWDYPDR